MHACTPTRPATPSPGSTRPIPRIGHSGTTLRTAAGFEIFIDAETGQVVFSLRNSAADRLFLLRLDSPLSAGEANVRKAEVTPTGDLRISFHRGRFSSPGAAAAACDATAP